MSVEIEKKYRLGEGDRERVLSAMTEAGAEFQSRDFEENTIFSGDVLGDGGAIVRIRTAGGRALLTYKRRVESLFDVKEQVELEVEVSDAATAAAILNELGLTPRIVYEKYRDTWLLRSVEVVLDELPFGEYMEIEGSVTAIREAEILLGIEALDVEHETYPRLTARFGRMANGAIEARFSPDRV